MFKRKPHSLETKMKISATKKAQHLHTAHSPEVLARIGKANLGKKLTEEHKQKLRDAKVYISSETRRKMSEARKGKYIGPNNPKWIADRSKLAKRQERNDMAYKEWRRSVWTRDEFKCRINNSSCFGRIEAHHILGWTAHPELRYEVTNGITLCHFHHPSKRSEESRLSPFFQEIINNLT